MIPAGLPRRSIFFAVEDLFFPPHRKKCKEVRKAPVGHKNHLDLSQFGADRAEEAKTLWEAKKNGKKEQDQPVVPSM